MLSAEMASRSLTLWNCVRRHVAVLDRAHDVRCERLRPVGFGPQPFDEVAVFRAPSLECFVVAADRVIGLARDDHRPRQRRLARLEQDKGVRGQSDGGPRERVGRDDDIRVDEQQPGRCRRAGADVARLGVIEGWPVADIDHHRAGMLGAHPIAAAVRAVVVDDDHFAVRHGHQQGQRLFEVFQATLAGHDRGHQRHGGVAKVVMSKVKARFRQSPLAVIRAMAAVVE